MKGLLFPYKIITASTVSLQIITTGSNRFHYWVQPLIIFKFLLCIMRACFDIASLRSMIFWNKW